MKVLAKWRNLFLVGFMGTGKSRQAKLLAPKLGREIFEMDKHIVEKFDGMSIKEIFATHSEARFREVETEVLREAISQENLIVSCGGGAFCQEPPNPNRELMLQNGVVVWLDVEFELLCARLARKKDRPLWSSDDIEKNRKLLYLRRPLYAQADYRISIIVEQKPQEVTQRIMEAIS